VGSQEDIVSQASSADARRAWGAMDGLLLLMVVFWGANYALVKELFRYLPPRAFNAVRMSVATALFLAAIAASAFLRRRARTVRERIVQATPGGARSLAVFRTASPISGGDWLVLIVLGLIGQFGYQAFFAEGLRRTSVANASLTIGCTPIMVSLASAALGRDRLGPMHWIGIAASALGMYLVVGVGARVSGESLSGDLMMLACVVCWTVYTLAGRELLLRHSPLIVTGVSMAIGTVLYVAWAQPVIETTSFATLPTFVWTGIALSALLALNVGYVIWYVGVQRLGSARTSLYSNLVPVAALVAAALWLGEPIAGAKLAGAILVIGGLAITRLRLPNRRELPLEQ
jgi:drug/metabolite transporter (DMT)-like permease